MAYTKYSLTPSSNTAAPPDGAPEGMLPSAVNDTMRDMMAQIRDCGDGIRDGTYTMTAPKITGGTITGSTINNSAIGGTTAAAGAFTTLSATGVTTVQAGTVSLPAITTTGDTNTGIYFPAADTIAFTEGGVESMRITSTGNVGIGTTSPLAKLTAADSSSGASTTGLVISNPNSAVLNTAARLHFDIANSLTRGSYIECINTAGANNPTALVFATNAANATPTERMRIDSSGNVLVGITSARANAGDVQVSKGISFPATQSAQSDANTLDDYEEGTWTPQYTFATSGTATMVTSSGAYTKVGRMVTVNFVAVTSAVSSPTGAATITGLPFTSAASGEAGGAIGEVRRFATDMPDLKLDINPSSSAINLLKQATNSSTNTSVDGADFSGSANFNRLHGTITYFV